MSLICPDIDKKISNYIFDPRYCISGNHHLKKIMVAFGRSKYDDFIKTCRDSFFMRVFRYYRLNDGDIYGLIQKFLKKKGKSGNVHFYQCYNIFIKSLDKDHISFNMLKPLHRMIVYYMSLYHGYLWISTKQVTNEGFGYAYYNFHSDSKEVIFEYSVLRRKKINNLKYYDLVEKGDSLETSKFKLKDFDDCDFDVCIFKRDVSVSKKDMSCIKIIHKYSNSVINKPM